MDGYELQALRITRHLTERQLGERLGTTQQTVHRWITGHTPIPRSAQKLLDFEFGDGTSGSAVDETKARVRSSWIAFATNCPAPALALVTIGAEAVAIDPDSPNLFEAKPASEESEAGVYFGDACGVIHKPLERITNLLTELGHSEQANDLHQLIRDMDTDELGQTLAHVVGALERQELLQHDIWSSVIDAVAESVENKASNEDKAA